MNAKRMALSKNITGWVKNTDEGDVEIMANGAEKNLQEFVAWCKQGPPHAVVTNVLATPKDEQQFYDFSIEI